MLSAFQAQAIHELKPKDKSKIETLLAYGDRLLVGLNTGALRIYRLNENLQHIAQPTDVFGSPSKDNGEHLKSKYKAVELLREDEKFSKKPVQQLAIVKEVNLLVSLSDGHVSLYDLQTYSLVERLDRTKGALCFAVTSNIIKDHESNIPSLVSRLVVGVKRKLMCWTWTDMELAEDVPEITMEGAVKTLTWSSDTKLAVGMDAGFSVVDIVAGEIALVNKPAIRMTATSKEDTELAGIRFAAVSSSGMGYMGMSSWVPKPMCTRVSGDELLFAKDVNTLFTDLSGKPLEKRQVPWSQAPEAIGFSYPYLLALQQPEKGILQIRNPDTLNLLQSIAVPQANIMHVPQPRISLAHAGKGFLVASERTIWRMNALSYPSQIEDLVEKGKFDEAVSFLGLLEDTLIDDKSGRIREVQVKKGEALFHDRKYRPALDIFVDVQASVDRVVRLYPRAIAGDLTSVADEPESDDTASTDEAPNLQVDSVARDPPATPSKTIVERFRATQTPQKASRADSDSASGLSSPRADVDNVSISSQTPTKCKPQSKALAGDDLKIAVHALCSYLAQSRQQVQRHLNFAGTLKEDPPALDPETHRPAFANLLPESLFQGTGPWGVDWEGELVKVAQLVDTTLFKSYMLTRPILAGSLFRVDNFCDPYVVQAALYESERYGDLLDFLNGKKLHRQSLEMLQKFGKRDVENEAEIPEGLDGPSRTVAYLKQLPPELIDMILEFVAWPIEIDKQLGLSVFTADSDNAERMNRQKVVQFLASIDVQLERQYLEHIIEEWHDDTPSFHQRLVELYITALKSTATDELDAQATKMKLEQLLRHSERYNRGQTFRLLDPHNPRLHESRAIVLTEMGSYKQALSVYVYQIRDFAKAEEHCARIYMQQQVAKGEEEKAAMAEQSRYTGVMAPTTVRSTNDEKSEADGNVFAMLLGLYLRPPTGEEKRWPQALELLSKHGSRLPASSTLDLMPDDLAVQQLQNYFRGRMRHSTALSREEGIVKGMEGVRRVRAETTLLLGKDYAEIGHDRPQGRNRRIVVREDDHCKVCHKRFGASAVRAWPEGSVTHYGCVLGKTERSRAW